MTLKDLLKIILPEVEAARTVENDPMQSFMFALSIPGIPDSVRFTSMSGLSKELAVVEYYEAGQDYAYKMAGRQSVGPITLVRGLKKEQDVENSYLRTLKDPAARVSMTLQILDRFKVVRRTYTLLEAWVSSYTLSDLDASSDDVITETLVIQYETYLTA